MTLEKFSHWNVQALKEFCKKKGLPSCGLKADLVSWAWTAWTMAMPDVPTLCQVQEENAQEYRSILKTPDGRTLPDPFSGLKEGWVGEEGGITQWPPVYLTDISDYLRRHEHDISTTSLRKRLLTDYKDQKAYSFFTSKWSYEVQYNSLSPSHPYCIMMANCTPSTKINNIPYTSWVAVHKKSGEINSAYCTCFAGYVKILFSNYNKYFNHKFIMLHVTVFYLRCTSVGDIFISYFFHIFSILVNDKLDDMTFTLKSVSQNIFSVTSDLVKVAFTYVPFSSKLNFVG